MLLGTKLFEDQIAKQKEEETVPELRDIPKVEMRNVPRNKESQVREVNYANALIFLENDIQDAMNDVGIAIDHKFEHYTMQTRKEQSLQEHTRTLEAAKRFCRVENKFDKEFEQLQEKYSSITMKNFKE